MVTDLSQGKPDKVLWRFCLPLFGSVIFQQLYNIADSLVVGKFEGDYALAAVGNSYEVTLLFMAFAFGCNIGCSVITSKLFGQKKISDLKTGIYTALISSGIVCLLLMALGFVFGNTLLVWLHTPDDIMYYSKLYLDIYILGLPFLFYYNIANGIFSAIGDSRTPFIFLVCSSLANIGLDFWFVAGFGTGVAGVAWATFICQGISSMLAMFVMLRQLHLFKAEGPVKVFSFPILKEIAVIAIPSTLQQGFVSVGNIFIQRMINNFGTAVIAGYAAGIKLNNLVITSFLTLGNGISNYTSQNLGAEKPERVREGFKAGWKLVWILCIPFCVLYLVFGRYLLLLFINPDASQALSTGVILLRILSPFYFVISIKLVSDGILRGYKRMTLFMISTFTDLILRVIFAWIFSTKMQTPTGIWLAWPIGWTISTGMSIFFAVRQTKNVDE